MNDNVVQNMLDNDEHIIWEGKPDRLTYIIGPVAIYIFALIWAAIDVPIMISFFSSGAPLYLLAFFALHLLPVWIAIGGPIYRMINWNYIQYAITGKRIYIASGAIGRDIKVIDFSDVREPSVNVGLIEKVRNCGSIQLKPCAEYSRQNGRSSNIGVLRHVTDPYVLYKQIKQMALDIRTDVSYPNAMRPDSNPGYNTQYSPRGNDNVDPNIF